MTSVTDFPLTWRCECGERPFNHYESCSRCGRDRPKVVVEQPQDVEPLKEMTVLDGSMIGVSEERYGLFVDHMHRTITIQLDTWNAMISRIRGLEAKLGERP